MKPQEMNLRKFKTMNKTSCFKNIKDEIITIYKQGDFEDLCRGPHHQIQE